MYRADIDLREAIIGPLFQQVRKEDLEQCARIAETLYANGSNMGPVNHLSLPESLFHRWLRHMYQRHEKRGLAMGVPAELLDGTVR
jgi:hypothetical protein